MIPIFFLASSYYFLIISTPDKFETRARKWRVSSGFDLSDDFWDTCDMLDSFRDIVLLVFFFLSTEILEVMTRILLPFRFRSSSKLDFSLSRESFEHLDFDYLRRTDPLIFPEAGLTGLRLCVLSRPGWFESSSPASCEFICTYFCIVWMSVFRFLKFDALFFWRGGFWFDFMPWNLALLFDASAGFMSWSMKSISAVVYWCLNFLFPRGCSVAAVRGSSGCGSGILTILKKLRLFVAGVLPFGFFVLSSFPLSFSTRFSSGMTFSFDSSSIS